MMSQFARDMWALRQADDSLFPNFEKEPTTLYASSFFCDSKEDLFELIADEENVQGWYINHTKRASSVSLTFHRGWSPLYGAVAIGQDRFLSFDVEGSGYRVLHINTEENKSFQKVEGFVQTEKSLSANSVREKYICHKILWQLTEAGEAKPSLKFFSGFSD